MSYYENNYLFSDSSKQRKRLRTKISSEKASLATLVTKHNQLADNLQVELGEVEMGVFAWRASDQDTEGMCHSLGELGAFSLL